jgi:hypothetical protein
MGLRLPYARLMQFVRTLSDTLYLNAPPSENDVAVNASEGVAEDVAARTASEDVASRTLTEPSEALLQQARSLTETLTEEEEEPCQQSLNSPVHLTRTVSGPLPSSC